ncbi:MAG: polysaccharide biosynthesis protein [Armatimonadetes bacterium]|nr:polysaccharide biosynthesis protein [Armatimonadota bacterium]
MTSVHRMVEHLVRLRRPIVVLIHMGLVSLAYVGAFLLRFDFAIPPREWALLWGSLPVMLVVRMTGFHLFGLHQGLWRYVSVGDLLTILKATTITTPVFAFAVAVLHLGREGFPRSVYLLDWMLCVALVAGVRLAVRAIREHQPWPWHRFKERTRVVIVGAGDTAETLLREFDRSLAAEYEVVALIDDDRGKRGTRIRGTQVVGAVEDLAAVCAERQAAEIFITTAPGATEPLRRALAVCHEQGCRIRRVPPLSDFLEGPIKVAQLQEVRPEDLLEREIAYVDLQAVGQHLAGKRIIITGAAGSIGGELAKQVAVHRPGVLVLIDRAESSLYFTYLELEQSYDGLVLIPAVADVQNAVRMREILRVHPADIVYHAAAYKHVPLMEDHPLEAIENNVFGTETVAREAARAGVRKFVLISTDKAVDPVSIMGMTKRVAERVVLSMAHEGATFLAVRFGNVLGSEGSVLPIFKWQAARWGRLTVTDPNASRYFMLPSEAVQLVLEASRMGGQGDILFLNMGEPVRVMDLAHRFLERSGFEPGLDVEISITGLRPGERLTETLVAEREDLSPTSHERIFRIRDNGFDREAFLRDLEDMRQCVRARDRAGAVHTLRRMASTY